MTIFYRDIASEDGNGPVALGPGQARYVTFGKRAFDLLAVLISLPIVLPILLVLSALILLRDGGMPFYRQKRLGLDGREFTMWKLRSMVIDADVRLIEHLDADPAARREWAIKQKLTKDPRITRFGAFLRKTSLDELPQLLNVLTGDMSLVGPRPMMPAQRSAYPGAVYERMRPGITGLWQISERNSCGFAGRAKFDTAYFGQQSLRTDLKILVATVGVVYKGTGC